MHRPNRTRLLLVLGALLLLIGLVPSTASAAPPTASFQKTSDWGTGFEAKYTVTNPGPGAITSWTVQFDLAANMSISSLWDGAMTRSGNRYTVTSTWNGNLAAGASTSFGFVGAYTGTFSNPTNCLINGSPCGGGGPGPTTTTSPSTSTSSTTSTTTTTTRPPPPPPGGPKRVAYFTQWGIYEAASPYFVRNLETSGLAARLTHLNYAFGNVNSSGRCFEANQLGQGDAWADYQRRMTAAESVDGVADTFNQPLAGNFNQLRKLKARHPNLRVLISLGGWTWSRFFSDAALTSASRQAFVSSCIDLFIRGNLPLIGGEPQGGPGSAANIFDGIDLDWEWPATEGNAGNVIRPQDKQNFTLLVQEFRRQLNALGQQTGRQYLLTAFLPASPSKITTGFEGAIFNSLDYATVQGYDLHGAWEPTTNHQSALFVPPGDPSPPASRFSVDLAIDTWVGLGAPRSKLVLGVPFYSRGWTNVPNVNNGLFQSGSAAPGKEAGYNDYSVVKPLTGQGYTLRRASAQGTAWIFNGSTFWTFDDPQAMREKAAYVRNEGLGGAMVWSADGDTPNGELAAALFG
jgi:chitinase